MTISAVTAGALIDPAWGNDVADKLNALPEVVQAGTLSGTTDVNGRLTVTFPTAFSSTPSVVATPLWNNASARCCHVITVSTTQAVIQFSVVSSGSGEAGSARSFAWVAVGS